jgi:hypothetical protein
VIVGKDDGASDAGESGEGTLGAAVFFLQGGLITGFSDGSVRYDDNVGVFTSGQIDKTLIIARLSGATGDEKIALRWAV